MKKEFPEVFYKKVVLKSFAKFGGIQLSQSVFMFGGAFFHLNRGANFISSGTSISYLAEL